MHENGVFVINLILSYRRKQRMEEKVFQKLHTVVPRNKSQNGTDILRELPKYVNFPKINNFIRNTNNINQFIQNYLTNDQFSTLHGIIRSKIGFFSS